MNSTINTKTNEHGYHCAKPRGKRLLDDSRSRCLDPTPWGKLFPACSTVFGLLAQCFGFSVSTKRMQAMGRRLSVVSSTSTPRRRLIRAVNKSGVWSGVQCEAVFALRLLRQMRLLSPRMKIWPSLRAGEAKTFSPNSLSAIA